MVPVAPLPTLPELDGLNTSAVAVALTVFPVFPQTREKNVGKLGRVTCTVTMGLTPKAQRDRQERSSPCSSWTTRHFRRSRSR